MKNRILLFLCLIGMSRVSNAQDFIQTVNSDSINDAYYAKMDDIFENVDLSLVPSGILYDRGFSYINMDYFDGTINDSSKTSPMAFGLAYASLRSMTVASSNNALPDPSFYRTAMNGVTAESDTIVVAGIHQEFHKMDTMSIENNLFTQVGDNLYDVSGRPSSPYNFDEVFLFSPAVTGVKSATINLKFNSNLFYNNTGKTIQDFDVDMDDDQGYRKSNINQAISANYTNSGQKNIKIKLTYTDNSVYYSHFDMFVEGPQTRSGSTPDIVHTITPTYDAIAEEGRGGGTINVFLACGHTEIQKPFIWAEGYNPVVGPIDLSLSVEDAIDRLSRDETLLHGQRLYDHLIENGYDIILLDYADGGDYLKRTGEFIEESIRWINTKKHAACSNEKNIIMGQSMGGVCSMLALKEMESTSEDHEVGTFIVFDSPIMGVNVPVSAQASLLAVAGASVNVPFSSDAGYLRDYVQILDDAVDLLNLPATRTMVKYMITVHPWVEPHLGPGFYNYLHNTLGGMPSDCDVLTITNGSNKGTSGTHNFNAGDLIVHGSANTMSAIAFFVNQFIDNDDESNIGVTTLTATATALGTIIAWIVGADVDTDVKLYAMPHYATGTIYSGFIEVDPWYAPPVVYSNTVWSVGVTTLPGIDNAPGGFVGMKNQGIILDDFDLGTLEPQVFEMQTWCFTPTMSVLNYHGAYTDNRFHDIQHNFQNNAAELAANNPEDVDNYLSNATTPNFGTAITYNNTAHTWFTEESAGYMLYHFVGDDLLAGVSTLSGSDYYNYGKASLVDGMVYNHWGTNTPIITNCILDHDLDVSNTFLGVNRNYNIGLTTGGSPSTLGIPNSTSSFTMHIGNSCVEDPTIYLTIKDGAELVLGDGFGRIGNVQVNDAHTIVVKSGGTIVINEGSSLILNDNSILILESGSKVINHGKMTLNHNSRVIYHDNAELVMDLSESEFVFNGGDLYIEDNATFKISNPSPSDPTGLFRLRKSAEIHGDPNSYFKLDGNSSSDRILILEKDAIMEFKDPGDLVEVKFQQGYARFYDNAQIHVPNEFYSVAFDYFNMGSLDNSYLRLLKHSRLYSSDLDDIRVRAHLGPYVANKLRMFNVNMTYSGQGKAVEVLGGSYLINDLDLDLTATAGQIYGIYSRNMISESLVVGCDLTGGPSAYLVDDMSHVMLKVKSSDFANASIGVNKTNGILGMKCNDFQNLGTGVRSGSNSELIMSVFGNEYGYNKFTNPMGKSIWFGSSDMPQLANGYNDFSKSSSGLYYEGNVNTAVLTGIDAKGNYWNGGVTPSNSDFSVTFSWTPGSVNYSDRMTATCGFYDTPIGLSGVPSIVHFNTSFLGEIPEIVIPGYNDQDPRAIDELIGEALVMSELYDTVNGNNTNALYLLRDIITFDYTTVNIDEDHLNFGLKYAANQMKSILINDFEQGNITTADNQSQFHSSVALYVSVLNKMSTILQDDEENLPLFFHEMEKAYLYRLIGHTGTALSILYNTESCGLDSLEQAYLNDFKFALSEEVAKVNYGYEAFLKDTVFTDTSDYTTPGNNGDTLYGFGTVINGLSSIVYTSSCSGQQNKVAITGDVNQFNIYPNPAQSFVNIAYKISDTEKGVFRLYGIDGKILNEVVLSPYQTDQYLDMSLRAKGIYLYSYTIDDAVIKTGKIVKE